MLVLEMTQDGYGTCKRRSALGRVTKGHSSSSCFQNHKKVLIFTFNQKMELPKFHGSKSCGNKTSCCSDMGVVPTKGGRYLHTIVSCSKITLWNGVGAGCSNPSGVLLV